MAQYNIRSISHYWIIQKWDDGKEQFTPLENSPHFKTKKTGKDYLKEHAKPCHLGLNTEPWCWLADKLPFEE